MTGVYSPHPRVHISDALSARVGDGPSSLDSCDVVAQKVARRIPGISVFSMRPMRGADRIGCRLATYLNPELISKINILKPFQLYPVLKIDEFCFAVGIWRKPTMVRYRRVEVVDLHRTQDVSFNQAF